MANYEFWLTNRNGVREEPLPTLTTASYTRRVNEMGWLDIDLPGSFDFTKLERDKRIEIWRSVAGQAWYLDTNTAWIIRKIGKGIDAGGKRYIRLGAFSGNFLLNTRIVAYNSGSTQADKTDNADDMMKEIVAENLGASATDSDRNLSTYLSIAADLAEASSTEKAFARRNVLTVLQEIAETSAQGGTDLFFDISYNSSTKLYTFETKTGQVSTDRSSKITFTPKFGNLTDCYLEYDYTEEKTYCYALGQGEAASRNVETASDTTRIAESPFNRVEIARDARHGTTTAFLQNEAKSAVYAGRPHINFRGQIQQTAGYLYGRDYYWGDKCKAEFDGVTFNVWLNAVTVRVTENSEVITAPIEVVQ